MKKYLVRAAKGCALIIIGALIGNSISESIDKKIVRIVNATLEKLSEE